jgi:hypothetical protein
MKAKRELKNINFDFEGAHIAITDESEPACSGEVEAVEFKSLTDNQTEILEELNVDPILASKSKESASDESLDGSQHKADNQNVNTKEIEDDMSQETLKALEAKLDAMEAANAKMADELATEKAHKSIAGFGLEAELEAKVAKALAKAEDSEVLVEALKSLADAKEEAVAKAVEAEDKKEENPVAKALSEEKGTAEESEAPVNKTMKQKLQELNAAKEA